MEDHVIREGERDTFVKLTYSAFRSDDSAESSSSVPFSKAPFSKLNDKEAKPRKWHLSKLPSLACFSLRPGPHRLCLPHMALAFRIS